MVGVLKTRTKYSPVIYLLLCVIFVLPRAFASPNSWNAVQVPEPLLFDLVRPLGAPKGELEFNTLGTRIFNYEKNYKNRLGHDPAFIVPPKIEYAPEVEYTYADGYGIEFELPFSDHQLEAYKLALQGTFSNSPFDRSINGWQFISLYNRLEKEMNLTGLYLLGVQLSERISSLLMLGADVNNHYKLGFIANPSFFYRYSDTLSFGIENNFFLSASERYYILLPQIEYGFGKGLSAQLGVGGFVSGHHKHMLAAMRLIYTHQN